MGMQPAAMPTTMEMTIWKNFITMLTSEGSVSRSTHVVADPRTQRLRTLTPIECERLNGFPDDWTAGMPERLRYFTMGNALVVPLVKAMGKRISALAEDEQRS